VRQQGRFADALSARIAEGTLGGWIRARDDAGRVSSDDYVRSGVGELLVGNRPLLPFLGHVNLA
jgi:hypothetical protein